MNYPEWVPSEFIRAHVSSMCPVMSDVNANYDLSVIRQVNLENRFIWHEIYEIKKAESILQDIDQIRKQIIDRTGESFLSYVIENTMSAIERMHGLTDFIALIKDCLEVTLSAKIYLFHPLFSLGEEIRDKFGKILCSIKAEVAMPILHLIKQQENMVLTELICIELIKEDVEERNKEVVEVDDD